MTKGCNMLHAMTFSFQLGACFTKREYRYALYSDFSDLVFQMKLTVYLLQTSMSLVPLSYMHF